MRLIEKSVTVKLSTYEKQMIQELADQETRSVTSYLRVLIKREHERTFPGKYPKEGER